MKITTLRLTEKNRTDLDRVVKESEYFDNRSEAIRFALRQFLQIHAVEEAEA